ncbi:unnamed protein product [Ceratitis capitata]|uniref:(Mediterranean fruit fly) hypothetical protein n=1 Tax=Ceratitis capitata TaxID=7213 RepID=A0A811UTW6_CERCA|nr:unnamed protein product [Ceratitis capitata]CAD7001177.1 unnamed protein product [Ceratitis capitata]
MIVNLTRSMATIASTTATTSTSQRLNNYSERIYEATMCSFLQHSRNLKVLRRTG